MTEIPEAILAKIQKLINLKEGAESVNSLAEAENAASKLQAILMKYNLELDQVKAQNIANRASVNVEEVWIDTEKLTKKSESFWVSRLYAGIARNNLCRIWWSHGKFIVNIIGHSHNIALVTYIADQLIEKIRIAEKSAWRVYFQTNGEYGEKKGTFRRGFLEGAAAAIGSRLDSDYQSMQDHSDNPFALMIVDKKKEVDEWVYKQYPVLDPKNRVPVVVNPNAPVVKPKKIKMRKGPRRNGSQDGWGHGYEAGKKMDINKGVDTTKSRDRIN